MQRKHLTSKITSIPSRRFVQVFLMGFLLCQTASIHAQHKLNVKRKEVKKLEQIAAVNPETNYLIIKRSRLEELPAALAKFPNLDSLDLYGNRLESIPDTAWDLIKNVTYLRLGKNPLEYIPQGITRLKKLEHLDLWNADVFDFHPDFLQMNQLKSLDIRMTGLSKAKVEEIVFLLDKTKVKTTRQCNCK